MGSTTAPPTSYPLIPDGVSALAMMRRRSCLKWVGFYRDPTGMSWCSHSIFLGYESPSLKGSLIIVGSFHRPSRQLDLLSREPFIRVLQLLLGGSTPVESQPSWLQAITYFLPSRHFVSFSQIIIYRGGGLAAVWRNFAMVAVIGLAFFSYSLLSAEAA